MNHNFSESFLHNQPNESNESFVMGCVRKSREMEKREKRKEMDKKERGTEKRCGGNEVTWRRLRNREKDGEKVRWRKIKREKERNGQMKR